MADKTDEYRRAFGNLSPTLRAKMAAMGILGPLEPDYQAPPCDVEYVDQFQAAPSVEIEDFEGDLLRDLVPGLTDTQVEQVLAWANAKSTAAAKTLAADMLFAVVGYLIRPGVDFLLATWGLIYAAGLDGIIVGNRSQIDQAKALGVSRARLNYYVSKWRDILGFSVMKFCRSDETRAVYSRRASKIHAEKNNPTPKTEQ